MQQYFQHVFQWIIQPTSWFGMGPAWQILGTWLFGFTILQLLPDSAAFGWLFCKQALKITLVLDAIWVYLIFASPFIPGGVTFALLVVAGLLIAAIASHKKWH